MSRRKPTTGGPVPARPARRRLLVGGAVLLAVLGVVGALVVRGGTGAGISPRAASAAPSASGAGARETPPPADPGSPVTLATAAPDAVPARVLAAVPGLPPKLTPVALAQPADYGDGLTARLAGIRSFKARGEGVGETSGPALAVTVQLTNRGSAPASLDTVAVNLFRGPAGLRAATLADGATLPFSGRLAPGATASATYSFSVPADQRDVVTVTVGTSAATGTAVFSGPVA